MTSRQLAQLCREYAENKKAENPVILDVRSQSSITDFFVVLTGTSGPHVRAIWNEVADKLLLDYQIRVRQPEGTAENQWIVLDLYDVIVHILRPEQREMYDLEGLWNDSKPIKPARVRPTPSRRKKS
ncbi:MAG: ribosome silencing factor [Pedosphaera sp.]|nr:ribosome silencing factor [Pedosphaera sp.]